MNYAVKIYKYLNPKINGAPDNYPAEVRPLGNGTTLPAGIGWQLMTDTDLTTLKQTYQTDYDTWVATSSASPQTENHEVYAYNSKGFVISQTFYRTKVSTGVYTDIARQILFTYDALGQSIIQTVETLYDTNGNPYSVSTKNTYQSTSSTSKTVVFEKQ